MDPLKKTTVAHAPHTFLGPLGEAGASDLLERLPLRPDDWVLDAGCGKAELLVRLLARTGASGLGVDLNPTFVAHARRRAVERGVGDRLRIFEGAMADCPVAAGSFAGALCIGAVHAFGSYADALVRLRGIVRPGGWILVGQGYWKRPPEADYLALLGATPDEMTDHAGTAALGESAGLALLWSGVSGLADWDHYETLYRRGIESFVAAHPADPDGPELLAQIRRWHDGYLRWGRETLGFGFYLFERA